MSEQNPLSEVGRQSLQAFYECEIAQYQRIIRIAHMAFGETDKPARPMLHVASPTESPREINAPVSVASFRPESMSLAEVQSRMPFSVALPAWVPDGFTFVDEVQAILPQAQEVTFHDSEGKPISKHAISSPTSVHLRWQREDEKGFSLSMNEISLPPADYPVFPIPVPPNSVREVSVSDMPAALIIAMHGIKVEHGDWANATPVIDDSMELRWALGDVQYSLRDATGDISADDFLRIANSIPIV